MKPMRTAILIGALAMIVACGARGLILYAQTLPSVRTAAWSPNPPGDNVVVYKLQLDSGPIQRVLPTACTGSPVVCTAPVSVPAFGAHTLRLIATNLAISTVPTSEQDGPAATITFTLNQAAGAVTDGTIR